MEPIDKLLNYLKGNHNWTRIYKPNELTYPISQSIEKNGKDICKSIEKLTESVDKLIKTFPIKE